MTKLPINQVSQYRRSVYNFWADKKVGVPISTARLIKNLKQQYPDEKREWKTIVPALNEELQNKFYLSRPKDNPKSWISNGFFTHSFTLNTATAKKIVNPKKDTKLYTEKEINDSFLDVSIRTLKKLGATVTIQF